MAVGGQGVVVRNLAELTALARGVFEAGLAPRGFKTKEQVLIAMLAGMELGLGPMTALRGISVANGTPKVWGDVALALARRSPRWHRMSEWYELAGKRIERPNPDTLDPSYTAVCQVTIEGDDGRPVVIERSFSLGEARKAGLLDKETYRSYLSRMLLRRARSYALSDALPEQFCGLPIADLHAGEAPRDIPVSDEAAELNTRIAAKEANAEGSDEQAG